MDVQSLVELCFQAQTCFCKHAYGNVLIHIMNLQTGFKIGLHMAYALCAIKCTFKIIHRLFGSNFG